MKKLIHLISFTICLISQYGFAQTTNASIGTSNLSKLYVNGGYGLSSGRLTGLGLNLIYLNNRGFSLSYNNFETPTKNIPSYYQNGNCSFGGCEGTTDVLNVYNFRMLREFNTNSKYVRFGVEGGLSIVKYKPADITNYNYLNNSSGYSGGGFYSGSSILNINTSYNLSGSNYSNEPETVAVGLSMRAKVAFPLTTFAGIELAAVSNINQFQSFVGAEIFLNIGLVGGK